MRSLLLIFAVVVGSNQLAAKVPLTPSATAQKVRSVVEVLTPVIGTDKLKEGKINALAQLLIDPQNPNMDFFIRSSRSNAHYYLMNEMSDQQGNKFNISPRELLNVGGERREVLELLLNSVKGVDKGDKGLVVHKRGLDAYISWIEFGKEGVIQQQLLKIDEQEGATLVDVTDTTDSMSVVNNGSAAWPEGYAPQAEVIPFTPTPSTIEAQFDNYDINIANTEELLETSNKDNRIALGLNQYLKVQQDERTQAHDAAIIGINSERAYELIWEGRRVLEESDFKAYISGMMSARALIEEAIKNDDELADKLGDDLADKLEKYLAGEAELSAAEFRTLRRHTSKLGYANVVGETGLRLETLLAIERVLAVHAKNVEKLGGDTYLGRLDAEQRDIHLTPTNLIRAAYNVYQQGKLQLQPVVHPLPKVVDISDADIKGADRQQAVQDIVARLDATDHLIYTDTFVNWLQQLDGELFELVEARLVEYEKMVAEDIYNDNDSQFLERSHDRQGSEITEDKSFDGVINPSVINSTSVKLRLYFTIAGSFMERHSKVKQVILLGGSTKYSSDYAGMDINEQRARMQSDEYKDEQQAVVLQLEQSMCDEKWLEDQIAKSLQAKENRQN